jgi:fanconi-associated nuclease 1
MRLVFRKPDQWHPRSSMQRFIQEIGDQGLDDALVALCEPVAEIIKKATPNGTTADEAIDLTGDSDDEEDLPAPDPDVKPCIEDPDGARLDFFCENELKMTLQDILKRLKKDKLKELSKEFKCTARKNAKVRSCKLFLGTSLTAFSQREDLVSALLSHAGNQSSIACFTSPVNSKKSKCRQGTLHNFVGGSSKNLLDRLKSVAAKKLGEHASCHSFDFILLMQPPRTMSSSQH